MVFGWMVGFTQNLSNKGKEFWVGYGHHQFMEWSITNPTSSSANSQEMVIYLSADQPANVTVSVNGTTWVKQYSVGANSVIITDKIPKTAPIDARFFTVPPSFGGTGGEGPFKNKAIHIVSDVPIVAYAHIYGSASSGATMLMPVETWGYAYMSVNSRQQYAADCYSWMYVIAKDDNTVIEITPSVPTRLGKPANVPFTATLMKGEAYQIIGAIQSGSTGYELTGTKVRSIANAQGKCYPVAVFAGSSRTSNSASCGSGGGDNDNQQLFPSQAWGKRYLTAPTSSSANAGTAMRNTFKIAVKDPNTTVKVNGTELNKSTLIRKSYYTYESNTADYIEADQPVMVGQFMTGGPCLNGGVGDPEMFFISPIEQGTKKVGFFRNDEEGITVNYLTLIIPTEGIKTLKIDGQLASATHTYPHPKLSGYSVVVKRWSATKTQCNVESDSSFNAVTYGLGSVESYAYNAGTMINNLNILSSIHNELDTSVAEHDYTCNNTPVKLGVRVAYQPTKMVWKLSTLGNAISPNADVTVDNPVPVDVVQVNGINYYRYQLPGSYSFAGSGDYEIPITSYNPGLERCDQSEDVKFTLKVRNKPTAEFTFTHSGCVTDTIYFAANASAPNGFGLDKWNWVFPDGTTSSLQNPKLVLPATGNNSITLKAISSEGCVGDTTVSINAFAPPTAAFDISAATICEGGSVSFTDKSSVAGGPAIKTWYWNFGNGTPITVNNSDQQTATYTTYEKYTAKLVVKSSETCVSDTVSQTITVYAKPTPDFTYPLDCLDPSGAVQFKSTTTTADGQALASYTWNFGDAAANATNPNTSTLESPSHSYNFGTYNITYGVTTVNGCFKDTTVKATFNIKPVLQYPALSAVCETVTGSVSVATASVTNSVPGNGIYKGPATNSAGQFTPSQAGSGTHTIWYVYTTDGGCIDSVSQNILVYAKPSLGFSFPSGGCLPTSGLAQFTNTSTIKDGQTVSYNWNFGDANATGTNPNTSTLVSPSHYYTKHDVYSIKLTAVTANGCGADTTISTTFSIQPELSFGSLSAVCENVTANVSVAKATVTNGVTGTGIYRGPGTDNAGNFNPALAKAGTHTIWFIYTANGGCKDSVSQTIVVYPKPIANFTVTGDICVDGLATINDQSTLATGSIVRWDWNFGDGTPDVSYTSNNPLTRSYAADKTYTIKLVATSNNSCVSDAVSKTVTVHPLPKADFSLPAGICMPNGSAQFTNTSTVADNSALSYQWSFGDGSAQSTSANATHTYATSGSYNVALIATSSFGCVSDTVKVLSSFYDKPVASFAVAPETLCQGTDNVFSDLSSAPNSTIQAWNWNFADGSSATTQNPVKKYATAGNYNVALTVTNAVGCVSDPFTKPVTVFVQPVIDAGPSFVVPQGTLIRFSPKVNDSTSVTFHWSPNIGFTNPTVLRPSLIANTNQTYTLTAQGAGNCTATDFLTVKILLPLKVPNAFSPNGDGINDTWEITNLFDYSDAVIEVFNRYGQPVFKSSGYQRPWDGTINGKPLPFGTYYYVINLKNGFKPITGSITIVR
jgi:gliding motility-associated-like protein